MAGFLLADANAFRIVAIGAKRRRAAGTDPLVAAFMALLLLFEALLQRLHQLLEAAHGLDFVHLFLAQEFLGHLAQPFLGNVGHVDGIRHAVQALEDVAEHLVELVDIALILHQGGARQVIKVSHLHIDDLFVHRLHQHQVFLQRDRHFGFTQFIEEVEEHGASFLSGRKR